MALQRTVLATQPTVDPVFGQVQQFYSPELADAGKRPAHPGGEQMAGYHVGAMLIRRPASEVGMKRRIHSTNLGIRAHKRARQGYLIDNPFKSRTFEAVLTRERLCDFEGVYQ